ncbi:MAG: conjugal transfer protein TraG [Phenylobacterium sp. RIFCSPHIGHO2_01_FULL_69_31]|uniref:type IV secretory system conjugative DNA transfer family protein n=1 Tax=Phenylobacterium sp. RIFCSPHIGHO2_01_FULL_69_31 TaxID=1801944 RepID=UPI0008BC1063|nr:type IV secretory system conjugative DNA transfer family protein [Phenylobacterium sp. RIFCSPHIGHO2_01_FULL_69_31]OHB26248.1 MAG: conjugal transfer protein TraG [Phenylobacterium sp. RIFCSPHIGHO2_01_FULL_69_31]
MNRFAHAPWPLKAAAFAAAASVGLGVWAAFAAAIALAGLKRLNSDLDWSVVPGWFWYFRHDPEVLRWLRIGSLSAFGLALVLSIAIASQIRRPLHGAARWASEAEIRRAGLRAATGIVLGRKGRRLLVFGGQEHVMLYAPTRTGKGVGVVIPNLLTWPGSVVVLDVKRENWDATAGFRAAHGQSVHLFDPLDPAGRTSRYNPLGHIVRDDPVAVLDELQRIAAMLFPHPPNADPFWAESARTGFVGVGAYLAESPERPLTFGAIYAELAAGDPRTRFPALVTRRREEGRPLSLGCVRALSDFTSASENTFASVRQSLTAKLNLWLNPRVDAATAASDFDLAALRSRRTSLYLAASPDNLIRLAPVYALLFQQLVDLSCRERPDPERHPHQVLVLLDEFPRLGHAEVLARAFAYVAGYGLRLLPVLQSPAQLRAEYGPDVTEEILANCAVEIAFAPKELRLARELSERLGDTTVRSPSRSRPSGLSRGHRTVSESDQRRPLLLPQELTQLAADDLIVLKAGARPVRGRKLRYYAERAFQRRLLPAPGVSPAPATPGPSEPDSRLEPDALTLEALVPGLASEGLEPLPPEGAPAAAVEAWVERFIDATAQPPAKEILHG